MKILFVSAVLPYPLYSGGQIRIYNLLKRLSTIHEIHLFSFIRSADEKEELSHVSFCRRVVTVVRGRVWQPKYLFKTISTSYPLLWSSYHNSEMLSLLSDELARGGYDLVHLEPGYVWPSLPQSNTPVVVCEHNIEHLVYEGYVRQFPISVLRPFLSLDVAKMTKWETRVWKEATRIVSVSEADRNAIAQSVSPEKISVVSNGVDTETFLFRPKKQWDSKKLTFLYVGDFRWMENKDAAEHLIRDWWPAIQAKYPGSRLRIVGKNAPKGQYFVGAVDDIQEELHAADALLAPIRIGGGTKYKILEAMAAGAPVITTKLGIEGMHAVHQKHVLLAETPEEVLPLLGALADMKKRMAITAAARKLVETRYSWDMIAGALDTAWKDAYARK